MRLSRQRFLQFFDLEILSRNRLGRLRIISLQALYLSGQIGDLFLQSCSIGLETGCQGLGLLRLCRQRFLKFVDLEMLGLDRFAVFGLVNLQALNLTGKLGDLLQQLRGFQLRIHGE